MTNRAKIVEGSESFPKIVTDEAIRMMANMRRPTLPLTVMVAIVAVVIFASLPY